ncbi:hypothetical protein SERLA73DRAFT_175057 [Serpula lacrymans var. lacrymans S7.3]|uniref:Uncharacterized protein n=2 Tax=Serpula lacrymans var. lacrymans TaxID=341189 RepID=F8PK96_SERL3|nr:uncharacterized protein SERLADRAFT_456995 [Serpula lacrymans var. lacrymans S7.9]EGO03550.1 hypothetical protein SERLA73DRAFT_175057 [Serpula lacrymans var. lacrymans S7.3]EGO29358.1 hypothetical protein SERLADRAFT_456995 [Serpula lacrymans var. lacrymans S7.9]
MPLTQYNVRTLVPQIWGFLVVAEGPEVKSRDRITILSPSPGLSPFREVMVSGQT